MLKTVRKPVCRNAIQVSLSIGKDYYGLAISSQEIYCKKSKNYCDTKRLWRQLIYDEEDCLSNYKPQVPRPWRQSGIKGVTSWAFCIPTSATHIEGLVSHLLMLGCLAHRGSFNRNFCSTGCGTHLPWGYAAWMKPTQFYLYVCTQSCDMAERCSRALRGRISVPLYKKPM